jgi:hypothetical protein
MDLSILIPSNKEPHFLNETINRFLIADNPNNYDIEILVSTPDPSVYNFESDKVKVIQDMPNKYMCVGKLYNDMYRRSSGEYVFMTADDLYPEPNFLRTIDIAKSPEINDRRFKLFALGHRGHPAYGLPNRPWPLLGCPIVARETIENEFCGQIVSENFFHHFVDAWMTFFVGHNGEVGEICWETQLITPGVTPKTPKYDEVDKARFLLMCEVLEKGFNTDYDQ